MGKRKLKQLAGELYDAILRLPLNERAKLARAAKRATVTGAENWTANAIAGAVLEMCRCSGHARLTESGKIVFEKRRG